MLARPRNVGVYEKRDGSHPFDDWMGGLKDLKGKAAIEARIGVLRRGSLGKKIRDVGNGIIELKVDSGPGYRLYIVDDGRNSLILCAGSKSTQAQDIKSAKSYLDDYKKRG